MFKSLILSLIVFAYPAHVSMMGIKYSNDKKCFEVSIKMDYDDFVTDYRYSINDDQVFEPSGKIDTTVILVTKYLEGKVQIFADDNQLKGKLVNIESADGELRLNLQFDYNKRANRFRVKNRILANVYKDQSNLLIFSYNEFEEGVKMTPEKIEHSFDIN